MQAALVSSTAVQAAMTWGGTSEAGLVGGRIGDALTLDGIALRPTSNEPVPAASAMAARASVVDQARATRLKPHLRSPPLALEMGLVEAT